jgi:hypothetical protein
LALKDLFFNDFLYHRLNDCRAAHIKARASITIIPLTAPDRSQTSWSIDEDRAAQESRDNAVAVSFAIPWFTVGASRRDFPFGAIVPENAISELSPFFPDSEHIAGAPSRRKSAQQETCLTRHFRSSERNLRVGD